MRSPVSSRLPAARMLLAASVVVCTVAFGSGLSSAASGRNTAPSLAPSVPGRIGGPASLDARNRNVSNKAGYQGETAVAIDPTNAKHVVVASNDLTGTNSSHAYETFNGGKTWADAGVGLTQFCYDPWLDFNAAGDLFFAYECSNQSYAYRLHGSNTWVKTAFPFSLTGNGPDRDMIVLDTTPASPFFNSAYIGYDDFAANNTAYVLYSRDGKTGWARSPKINDASATIGVNVAVGSDGTIYASWLDYPNSRILMDKSTDGGAHWGTDKVVHNMVLNTSGFSISIPPQQSRGIVPWPFTVGAPAGTPHAGRIYVTYEDRASGGGLDTNSYVTFTDNGSTFSTPVKVNDDSGGAYQFFPAIAVTPNGNVGLSWYDTRNDATNHKTDQFFSFSSDGGTSWAANRKITTAQSDETGGGANANQYGDYEGLDGGPTNRFGASWTDSRPGNLNEELYYTKIRIT
jgi:hypothetical protein